MVLRKTNVRRLRTSTLAEAQRLLRQAGKLSTAKSCCLVLLSLFATGPAVAQIARTDGAQPGETAPFGVRLENFDIRTSDEKAAVQALINRREARLGDRSQLASSESLMVTARESLAAAIPNLRLIDSRETGAPEIVGISYGNMDRLTAPSDAPNESIARSFVQANSWLYGLSSEQVGSLATAADYTNPAGNISWVRLEQSINDLPVFRGYLTVALTPRGEVLRTMGQLAAALPAEIPPPSPKLTAAQAIATGAGVLDMKVDADDLVAMEIADDGFSATFERGPFAWETDIELVYFPLGPGAVELAWSMTLWGEIDAYYMLISADDGLPLFNKNITEHQTQSATFEVYRNANAYIDVADSPAPLSPGPNDPNAGTQGSLMNRANVTLIGNEGPLSFNNNGWVSPGTNVTDGNNVEAGLDIDGSDGVDAPVTGVGRVFSSAWNPPPGDPVPGDAPTTAEAQRGAVIQMFYVTNRYHDALYQLGFTEGAFNFQDDNFGRGGAGGDRVRAEGQDSSGTNNANFSTPADGGRGRMQMFRWTGPNPDRDGTADADIIIHELTHGTSNRLHGNSSGLGTNMARGMGEGWSDFYAHALLAEPTDPINSTYSLGGYSTLEVASGFTGNYYYGIRRFPKAVMAHTGGPGNRPHNPLTFADLNAGCDVTDGAFPRGPIGSSTCDQVHNAGEIWSSALWEVRGQMITRLGFAAGNQRALQVVTDGMKLSPANPTFLDARDAILQAASALSLAEDVADVWEGFRIRGMGFSAEVLTISPANVVEAFDSPNLTFADPISYVNVTCSDPAFTPVPGDTLAIEIPITNASGAPITSVTATLAGSTTASYGTIAGGATVSKVFFYTIPEATACGDVLSLPITGSSAIGALTPASYDLQVGIPGTATTNFSNSTPIDIPAGQPTSTSGAASPYPSKIDVSGITANVLGATLTLNNLNHTWVGDVDILLEGPGGETFVPMSDSFSSNNRTDTVVATLLLTDDAAATMPSSGVLPAAGTFKPTNHSTSDTFDAPAPAGPYNHPAPGGAATFASVFSNIDANGKWKLWIDDDAGGDPGTLDNGWSLGIVTAQIPECPSCGDAFCAPSVDLEAQEVNTTLAVEACEQLTAADFGVLGPGGDVTLTAGEKIVFYSGVTVEDGASLECGIDPSLLPVP